MIDFEKLAPPPIRKSVPFFARIVAGSALLLAAVSLRADQPAAAGAAPAAAPIWVSPISPYDPAEGTAAAHAVQIDAGPHSAYVQTAAYADSVPAPTAGPNIAPGAGPEQLPPGGYLWGGSSTAPGSAASSPSVGYSVPGSTPPPETQGWPVTGNLMGGLGFGVSAPVGLPPLGPLFSNEPIIALPNVSPDAFHTIFRLHQSITDEVGDDGPVTSIGGFFPHTMANGLWFIDGEFNLLEDANNPGQQTENFGANVGIGFRWIVPELSSVAGLSFWYDLDRTRPDFVHQPGVSGELLGSVWQARVNGYFPCGTNRLSTFSPLGPAVYVGENIDFGQTRYDSLDMAGMDFEFGRRLPGWLGENGVSAYVGGYYYRADDTFNTFGVATRIEALISPNLTIDAKFTNDPLFKNRVGIGITWLLPAGKCKTCAPETCSEVYRLTEPVERNRTVVYATQAVNAPQVAINPATGLPIIVVHVDSAAPPGGNGTVNDPYNNLPAAQAGSAPNDIILVQAASVFTGQSIALQNSQRFLGEGIPHTVDTVQAGVITLPTTSASTVLPVIANSPGDAVTLANSNEVSGFTINNSGGSAIAGNGISGTANINNVQINGGVTGINIQNSSAAVTVTSTPISGAATGISLTNNTGSFDFSGMQTVTGSTATGVLLSGNSAPVTFDNLQLSATTGTGLSATKQTGTLTITAGAITALDGTGVTINNSGTTAAPLAVTLASVNAAGGANGISLNNAAGTFTVTGSGTTAGSGGTISDTTGTGVSITGESGQVAINYMNITDPAADGVDVNTSATTANVTLTGTQITLAGGQTGVSVNQNSGAFALNNATVTGGGTGVRIENSSGTNDLASFTATNASNGVSFINNTGTVDATGTTTVNGSTAVGVRVDNNSGAVTFDNLQVAATSGTALESNGQSGTFTVSAGTISNANGTAVQIQGPGAAGVPLAVTLQSVSSSGGANGISLNQAGGSFTVTGTGTTAGSGGTINSSANDGIVIRNEAGTVALSNMNVTNPGANGVNVSNSLAAANVSLTNLQVSGAASSGINAQNNAGTLTVTGATLAATNSGVNLQNNTGTVNVDSTNVTGGNTGVNIVSGSGANNFASLTVNNAANGINVQNATGSVTASGTTTITGSTHFGVELTNNSAPVSFSDLEVTATSGTGLFANGQSGLLTITTGNISSANGTGVQIDTGASAGTPLAVNLQSVSSTGGNFGIEMKNAAGTFTVTGTGTTAGSGGTIANSTSDGIQINNEIGTVALANINVTDPHGNGVNLNTPSATSNITLSGLDISGQGQDGVLVQNNAGLVTVTNPTITGGSHDGVNINGNTGSIAITNGTIGTSISPNAGVGINVTNNTGTLAVTGTTVTGGTTGLEIANSAGTTTIANFTSNGAATGIDLNTDTAAINFTGTTATSGSTSYGVYINDVTAPVSFATLNINSVGGVGFSMTSSPTTLTVTGGTISSTGGDAVDISGNAILAVTLGSVSDNGGTQGINLSSVSGSFTVNGGTIQNTSGNGVLLDGYGTVSLNNMTITATGAAGVSAILGANLTVNDSFIDTVASGNNGIFAEGITGTANITNNVVVFANAAGIDLIPISTGGTYNVDNNILETTSTTSAVGLESLDVAVGNNTFDVSGNTMFLGSASSGTGILMTKDFAGTDFLSSSSNNAVIATTPSSFTAILGSFSGTIEVNGTPEP